MKHSSSCVNTNLLRGNRITFLHIIWSWRNHILNWQYKPPCFLCSPLWSVSHPPGEHQPEQCHSTVAWARPAQRSYPGVRHQILWKGTQRKHFSHLKKAWKKQMLQTLVLGFFFNIYCLFSKNNIKLFRQLWEEQKWHVLPGEHKLIVFRGPCLSRGKIFWMQRSGGWILDNLIQEKDPAGTSANWKEMEVERGRARRRMRRYGFQLSKSDSDSKRLAGS